MIPTRPSDRTENIKKISGPRPEPRAGACIPHLISLLCLPGEAHATGFQALETQTCGVSKGWKTRKGRIMDSRMMCGTRMNGKMILLPNLSRLRRKQVGMIPSPTKNRLMTTVKGMFPNLLDASTNWTPQESVGLQVDAGKRVFEKDSNRGDARRWAWITNIYWSLLPLCREPCRELCRKGCKTGEESTKLATRLATKLKKLDASGAQSFSNRVRQDFPSTLWDGSERHQEMRK
jgi:hypothetical protein